MVHCATYSYSAFVPGSNMKHKSDVISCTEFLASLTTPQILGKVQTPRMMTRCLSRATLVMNVRCSVACSELFPRSQGDYFANNNRIACNAQPPIKCHHLSFGRPCARNAMPVWDVCSDSWTTLFLVLAYPPFRHTLPSKAVVFSSAPFFSPLHPLPRKRNV